MFQVFNKSNLSALIALLSLGAANSSLTANDCYYPFPCEEEFSCNRFYIGGFGGQAYAYSTTLRQTGTAFFLESDGGPLAVDARGDSNKPSPGFGGFQIGYAWAESPSYLGFSDWTLTPAAEIEGLFFSQTRKGDLFNPTDRLDEHDFQNTFPMNVGMYLVNGVLNLNACWLGNFSPYVGGGVGVANISIRHADSLQVDPVEEGINHFNSQRGDTTWAFAAQVKAGLSYKIFERVRIFAEYRALYVDTNKYNLGSTVYPDHPVTSTWNVEVKNSWYNAFAVGLQLDI